ncbi:MAG: hypothetical protein AB1746_08600, partial [Candidatus Zixiibacteriota bacterium]
MGGTDSKSYQTLNMLWAAGMAITFFLAALIPSWEKYTRLFSVDFVLFLESSILGLITFILFLRYAIASHHELTMLEEYLNGSTAPRVKAKTYLVIFLLAVFFGFLISYTDSLEIYTSVYLLYILFDLWGGWQVQVILRPLIDKRLAGNISEKDRKIIIEIEKFYFKHPVLQRIVTLMFVNWIVICLAIIAYMTTNENLSFLRNLGYILLIANIIWGEILIFLWRYKRDRE